MKPTQFAVIVGVCLLIVLGSPGIWNQSQERSEAIQRQEEQAPLYDNEGIDPSSKGTLLEIRYQVKNPNEEQMADIAWLREAAQTALDSGSPYFYVVEQSITKKMIPGHKAPLSFLEGIIELETDPMAAEYDANEILELHLPEETQI